MIALGLSVLALCCALSVQGADPNSCTPIAGQTDTASFLIDLRREMQTAGISVYVIFADDEHGSEYTQPYDKRRNWLTGFRGSSGTAAVSATEAAVWTDSRYFTQAEEQLDCRNWLLMRSGNPGVPTLINWLISEANRSSLPPGTTAVFTTSAWWSSANTALQPTGKTLRPVGDLVGRIWPSNQRPAAAQNRIKTHDIQYAGETVAMKLNRTTTELRRVGASLVVLSALDEIAWLFNLRGEDIPYNPFFKSYAIVYSNYVTNRPELYLNLEQLSSASYPPGVTVRGYDTFWGGLNASVTNPSVTSVWASPQVSQAIFNIIPEAKLLRPLMNSPVQSIKAQKNPVEREGMRNCQVRDAVARMKHLGWLEQQLNDGKTVNETQSSEQLLVYQNQQERFQFPSFGSISAVGDRAAVVHYSPEPSTARLITKNEVYLLDAGGQYLDCTTDITRTHHFGTPKPLEKRAYTRVLQGVLDVAAAVFPAGTQGRSIDYLGRMSLYKDGMTFGHTVGHGVGHFLGVHEGPQRIGPAYNQYEEGLADGVFLSDEPGFYKDGDFGIRIENEIETVLANKSLYETTQFLRFDTITLVPYERSLIDTSLLTKAQFEAIDQYHRKVLARLEPLLSGDAPALNALRSRTTSLNSTSTTSSSTPSLPPATSSSTPSLPPVTSSPQPTTTNKSSLSKLSSSDTSSLLVSCILLLTLLFPINGHL